MRNYFFTDIFLALETVVFRNTLPLIPVYSFSDVKFPKGYDASLAAGAYTTIETDPVLLINVEYLCRKPLEYTINIVYHEMIHYFCDLNGIHDTDNRNGYTYHRKEFKDAVKENGEICC